MSSEVLGMFRQVHPETPNPYQTKAFSSVMLNPNSILDQIGLKANF